MGVPFGLLEEEKIRQHTQADPFNDKAEKTFSTYRCAGANCDS